MGMEEAAGTCPPQHGGGEQGRGERDRGGILPLRGKIDKLRRELLCRELRRRFLHHLLELLEGRPPGIIGKAQDGQLDLGRQSPSLRHQREDAPWIPDSCVPTQDCGGFFRRHTNTWHFLTPAGHNVLLNLPRQKEKA